MKACRNWSGRPACGTGNTVRRKWREYGSGWRIATDVMGVDRRKAAWHVELATGAQMFLMRCAAMHVRVPEGLQSVNVADPAQAVM